MRARSVGRDWFAAPPGDGPVIYVNAEDDERELHFRFDAIRAHLGTTFAALADLHLVPLAGEDALLGVPDRTGIIQPTPLFERLLKSRREHPARIDRPRHGRRCVRRKRERPQPSWQFISLVAPSRPLTGNAAVLLASHPSLSGINSDSGPSGSTGWHNSVRSWLFFKAADSGDDAGSDQRELIVSENNFGPTGISDS